MILNFVEEEKNLKNDLKFDYFYKYSIFLYKNS